MEDYPLEASSRNQQRAVDAFHKVQILVLGGAMFGGKVQPYTSNVKTKFGDKLLRDITVGSKILNPNGTEQTVIAVHPHKDHQFYKVVFDDGATTYCGKEHLWLAWRSQKLTKKGLKLDKIYGPPSQESLYPTSAEVLSLKSIMEWIAKGHTVNIPVTQPLPYTTARTNYVDPYLMGILLGDGCITKANTLGITRHEDDSEIDEELLRRGIPTYTIPSSDIALKLDKDYKPSVVHLLEKYNLIGTYSHTKFIPKFYQTMPIEVRQSLLQGLMDSDGYVDERGHLEYTTVSPQLSADFIELVRGLGGKCQVNTKMGSYRDKAGVKVECREAYRHYFRLPACIKPFVLTRKASRVKEHGRLSRKIVSITEAMVCDGACITVSDPNRLYLTDDCVVTHNSYLASMLSTLYADDPKSRIAVFRNTLEQMKMGGGIIDTIQSVYDKVEDHYRLDVSGSPPVGKILSGPGKGKRRGDGCRFNFLAMDHHKDMEKIRGGAFSLAIVEEAIPNFTQDQIEMIMSRLRSESRHESKMIITCNPSPDHYICDLIKDYYLDEEGYPIDERCGDIRYFGRLRDDYIWGESREEVSEVMLAQMTPQEIEEHELKDITSFSFVQLTAKDNPIGCKLNPGYMAYLKGLNPIMKARNLYGNWFIRPENTGVFERHWIRGDKGQLVKGLDEVPRGCVALRGIDKAHEIPSEVNPSPDFTAISPLVLKDRSGFYWLLGNYIPEAHDKPVKKSDKKVLGRFRRRAGSRDMLIAAQMAADQDLMETYGYLEPKLVVPKDSGAGTGDYNATIALMAEEGVKTIKDKTTSNAKGKKLKDFLGFCNACENGLVFIVEATFDKESLDYLYYEWEIFDGETNSTQLRKDDCVDAMSIAFNASATSKRPYRTIIRNQRRTETLSASLLNRD